jgi:hypothetical protein
LLLADAIVRALIWPLLALGFLAACTGLGPPKGPGGADVPRIGSELVLSSRAADEEEDPVPSWNGQRFLVVWQSTRRGPSDVYGTWVSPDHTVAPRDGFPIGQGPSDTLFPDVTWGGDVHLVLWQDLRSRRNWEIYGARVRPDGTVLEPEGLAIGVGSGNRRHPRVAWSGRVFLAVWMQERSGAGWDIVAARIAPDGKVLDPEGLVVGGGDQDQTRPAVAWNGRTFVVAWMDARRGETDISAARVDDEGRVLDPEGIAVSLADGEQGYPAVGGLRGSGDSLVVWVDKRAGDTYALFGTTLTPDGRVSEPAGVAFSSAPRFHMFPAASCRAEDCLVVWEEGHPSSSATTRITDVVRDVRALWWARDRKPIPFTVVPDSKGNHFTTVAAGGTGYLVAWKDYRTGRAESLARLIDLR